MAACRDVGMACTRKTKTLVSTCVILSGMTNIVCLLYVGWVTNYIANIHIRVPVPSPERKLEGDKRGDTIRIMERLDRLENVVNQHIQGREKPSLLLLCSVKLRNSGVNEECSGKVFCVGETGCSKMFVCTILNSLRVWNSDKGVVPQHLHL